MEKHEIINNYVYSYESSKPLLDQSIKKFEDLYLVNVRKVYTDNTYFGVSFTIFQNNSFSHLFKCKDRHNGAFGNENLIDDKKYTLDNFKYYYIDTNEADVLMDGDTYYLKLINLSIPLKTYFAYNEAGDYSFTHIDISNSSYIRGLYGTSVEKWYKKRISNYPNEKHLYKREPTRAEVIDLIKNSTSKFSNAEFTVNTAYSTVKVETLAQNRRKNNE